MFRGTQENFFDRLNDLLEKRKLFHQRLNHPEKGNVYREYLRQSFDQKIKEKRLGGARLQAKASKVLAAIGLALLAYGLVVHHTITVLGSLVTIGYAGWTHFSALEKLLKPLEEADRAARDGTNAYFRPSAPVSPPPAAPATPSAQPLTPEELIRRAAEQAQQRQRTTS